MTTASSETTTRYYADESRIYEVTGECRPPIVGEYVLWRGAPLLSRFPVQDRYTILRPLSPRDAARLLNPPPPDVCECDQRPSGSFRFGDEDVSRCPACSRVIA